MSAQPQPIVPRGPSGRNAPLRAMLAPLTGRLTVVPRVAEYLYGYGCSRTMEHATALHAVELNRLAVSVTNHSSG